MDRTLAQINPKGKERIGNDATEQLAMPFLGLVRDNRMVAADFISRAAWDGVLRLCVQWSGKDDYEVADDIGVSHGQMSKVLKGTAGLWGARLVKFMRATESLAPLQWLADQMGCDIVRRAPAEAEIDRLRREAAEKDREIAELRRRRG